LKASPPPLPQPRGVTPRAVLLGLALIPLNAYWVILAELRWYTILTLNPLFVSPVFALLLLVGVNALLGLLRPRAAFSVPELLVVYIMLAISCTVATHDFSINLVTIMGWGAWFASPENKWAETILPHLPKWAVVSDMTVLKRFMEGDASLYRADILAAWLPPLLIWVAFMVVIFGTMLCLNVMVRRAWIEETKLGFPIVRLPLAMVGMETRGFYRSPLLWLGVILPVLNGTLNGLARLYPALPHFETRAHWPPFTSPPWNMLWAPYSFYPFAIGLGYFVPLDVLFSCWFFYLFSKAQIVAGYYVGLTRLPGYPYAMEQGIGAWMTYGALILYITRERWRRLFTELFSGESLGDEDEFLPYRAAFYGAATGIVLCIIFWRCIGMTLFPATLMMVMYFLLALCITRVRAEAGSQHTVWDLEPMNTFGLVDTRLLGTGNIVGAGMAHWFWRLNRSHAMPTQLEALKMWHDAGMRPRDLALPMIAATVVASLAGPWAVLHVGYREGMATRCVGFARWTGYEVFGWMQSMLVSGRGFEWPRLVAVAAASGLTLLLWSLQARYTFLWFHPLGYCAGPGLVWVWCPFLIAWIIKYSVVRWGGQKAYKRLIPLFLGLVLGDYCIGAAWAIIGPLMGFEGYQIFH
jgi:hypothetical protein